MSQPNKARIIQDKLNLSIQWLINYCLSSIKNMRFYRTLIFIFNPDMIMRISLLLIISSLFGGKISGFTPDRTII